MKINLAPDTYSVDFLNSNTQMALSLQEKANDKSSYCLQIEDLVLEEDERLKIKESNNIIYDEINNSITIDGSKIEHKPIINFIDNKLGEKVSRLAEDDFQYNLYFFIQDFKNNEVKNGWGIGDKLYFENSVAIIVGYNLVYNPLSENPLYQKEHVDIVSYNGNLNYEKINREQKEREAAMGIKADEFLSGIYYRYRIYKEDKDDKQN